TCDDSIQTSHPPQELPHGRSGPAGPTHPNKAHPLPPLAVLRLPSRHPPCGASSAPSDTARSDWPPSLPRDLPTEERRERRGLAVGCFGLLQRLPLPLWGAAQGTGGRPSAPSLPTRSCRRAPCPAARSGSPRSAPPPRGTCAARLVPPQPCPSHRPSPPSQPDELYFEEGDIIYISDMSDTNWWKGTCKGRTGLIPSNYVAEQAESIDNPLHEAAKRGNLSWLRECLDNRVGVNGLDKAGNTALYWACHGGHKDIVDVLFTQANLELNQQNKLGDTALHAAAWKGYADIVEMLLAKGARTDLKNNEKKLALDMATNAACASLLKKKQTAGTARTLSNAEEYLDDEDSD
uniref:Osteoclast-stimulating factor 1 n=2 Tax=Coturnix japonica TaxID=93934 RepID=A0A8C2T9E3_COTJA